MVVASPSPSPDGSVRTPFQNERLRVRDGTMVLWRALVVTGLFATLAACGRSSLEEDMGGDTATRDAFPVDTAPLAEEPVDDGPATTVDAGTESIFDAGEDASRESGIDAAEAGVEGSTDAATDAAPRPIAPLSTSRVTSRRPTLHWVLASGATDATVDLCVDRACTNRIGASVHVTGTSYAPTRDLPSGVVYWRLHPGTVATVTSATWEFTVGARSAPVDTSWGTTLDVNGDGYPDLVVGVAYAPAAYVYLGSANGLAGAPAFTLTGEDDAGGEFGNRVASAGDVNGDGYADLAVGDSNELGVGSVYVYLGGASGLAPAPVELVDPDDAGLDFGASLTSAGDINGDGYTDLVVGAIGTALRAGRAYVYFGSADGLATVPAVTLVDPTGEINNDFGYSLASADVNGDGRSDLVVGASSSLIGASGHAYVYLGGPDGLATDPATTLTAPISTLAVSIANAGDVNGDGYADLVVSAYDASSVYVYLGSASGIGTTPATTLIGQDVGFGFSFASAGDVNGDGYSDLVIDDPYTANFTGTVYLFFGGATGVSASPATTLPGFGSEGFFGSTLGSAGDVNGDGYSDLAVNGGDLPLSAVRLYLGGPTGFAASPVTALQSPDGGLYAGSSVFGASN